MCATLSATAGIISALALLLIKETVSEAFERQEIARDSVCPLCFCLEPEVADLDFEFPFLCGLDTGVIVAHALAVFLVLFPC